MEKKCVVCEKVYFAKRATSKFCSSTCRSRFSRDIGTEPITQEAPAGDWANSAGTKSQAEIEAHYTLANFPPVKYHSTNGGGSGSYSPYPSTDPRCKAYAVR